MTDTELNERLALKAGYTRFSWHENDTFAPLWKRGDYLNPDPPDYTHSLDLCFRDIKPLIIARNGAIHIHIAGKFAVVEIWDYANETITPVPNTSTVEIDGIKKHIAVGNTDALAFCEAAWKFLSE
jgi:hypothetical protein